MEREIQKHKVYLRIANELGSLSRCNRAQVGALIVKDNNIVSYGYNGTPAGFNNCCEDSDGLTNKTVIHAETNAILKGGRECQDADLYLTLSPCVECCKLIKQAGIKTVYFSSIYRDTSGLDKLQLDYKLIKLKYE